MAESRLSILFSVQGATQAEGALKSLGAELGSLGRVAGAFTLGALATELSGGIAEQLKSVLTETQRFGEQVYRLQGQIGGTAESLSVLIGAFEKLGGIGADQAGTALTRFGRALRGQVDVTELGAESGKTFAGVLGELGVSAVDATGHFRPIVDVLASVMDSEKRLSAEGRAGADSMILFGRGVGLQLAPMLLLGADAFKEAEQTAQTLGLQLTGQNVQSIHTFTLRQREMNEALAGLKLQLGVALLGPLTEFAKHVSDVAVELNKDNGAAVKKFGADIGDFGISAFNAAGQLKEFFDQLDRIKGSGAELGKAMPGGQGVAGTIALATRNTVQEMRDIKEAMSRPGGTTIEITGPLVPTLSVNPAVLAQVKAEREAEQRRVAGINAAMQATFPTSTRADSATHEAEIGAIAQRGVDAAAAAGFTRSERLLALDQQELGVKRFLEIQTHDIAVAQRENLDLVQSEAQAQMGLIPLKAQQAQIALDILRTEDQRSQIARQTMLDQARLGAQPSSFALQDSQNRQALIRAQISAGVMGGGGIPQGAIPELIALARAQPALQVAALLGQQPVIAATRAADTGALGASIATAPARMDAADLAIKLASTQLTVDAIHAEIEQDKLDAVIAVADLQKATRAAEDKAFEIGQRKQELAPIINTFTYEQHITTTGEFDKEAAKQDAIAVFSELLVRSAAAFNPPAPSTVPGAAY